MKKSKHIIYSTILTFVINIIPMLIFKSKLPSEVPIHWDMSGNVNGSLPQALFVYATPTVMGLLNLIGCYKYSSKFSKNVKLYYIIPIVCLLITFLMLYLALK
ncbi:TPA: DUF1648 domain-containing protein [Streptococcus suis]|uniref:DUF1648 domain-containing protein n=1 Tax=Enterococcus faecalis TaxID=1351 RepID=UPI002A7B9DFA|nr:DUF1648 domain-containing protein [Streptococcus suis]HEL2311125.1 DUF1648 domain-containing protein [Streptococcus suis]HEL2655192.1 DUF1648 domain-containing protein [Streptococcus suis]HEM2714700.1 DUF1648 domain-containing protein [Streptococcus suis]HEP1782677.1 DUF1648 domain-containing protein [Streptococcus suis]